MRDSDLIRKLLKSGLSFRQVSKIANCSHGSVSAEKSAMKKEELDLKMKLEAQNKAEKELQAMVTVFPEISAAEMPKA